MTLPTLAFLGIGLMGKPMAIRLVQAGFPVRAWNRRFAKADALRAAGADPHASIEAAVSGADIVISMLASGAVVGQVLDAALPVLREGATWIDMSSTQHAEALAFHARLAARGLRFIDAPVSGGQAGAESGKLTVMVGGDPETFAAAQAALACFARAVTHMGPSGSGQLTKMVNQICIAGLVQGLAEGLAFAEKAGLDGHQVIDVISKGAAQSWQMENRGHTMLDRKFDFGFAVDWMRKDLAICFEEARRNGSRLPVAELVDQFYGTIQASGGNRLDTSSLMLLVAGDAPAKERK